MSTQRKNPIRNNEHFKNISTKKYLKIFVPEFAFKHDNDFSNKDKFVGREVQLRRLFMWLTSDSKSGSYLITGYRGMGKSLLVKRVLNSICRRNEPWPELVFDLGIVFAFIFSFIWVVGRKFPSDFETINQFNWLFGLSSCLCLAYVVAHKYMPYIKFYLKAGKWKTKSKASWEQLSKYVVKFKDERSQEYFRIPINVNLGQEILNERDVLSVIAYNIRNKYVRYVRNRQSRPLQGYIPLMVLSMASCFLVTYGISPFNSLLTDLLGDNNGFLSKIQSTFGQNYFVRYVTLLFVLSLIFFSLLYFLYNKLRVILPFVSAPHKAIHRLNNLCDRISANINEEKSSTSSMQKEGLKLSLFQARKKAYPIANVREIEQELQDIINSVNEQGACPKSFRAQFIIVFDELDKVSNEKRKNVDSEDNRTVNVPEFDASVEGFTGTMGYEERKKDVLHLLANMKFFITTVNAKCVFISGHELFDASLADLSDREFAISSIFNGVLNIDSFLTPEREQNEVSSMTELYLATLLLPQDFIVQKMKKNLDDNGILKEELPSLRWYNDYLLEDMLESSKNQNRNEEWIKQRTIEIRFVLEFLRHFAVYLSHISNGSPKKIATYFEKYIKTQYDTKRLYEWGDIIEVGHSEEKNEKMQCVLWFDNNTQRFINFVSYIASPLMRTITNEISHFGDKLLVTSSFILDQVYKYHGKGFSWRNLEQMPELLNANKNPELRDSMSTMMEYLLQTHISRISAGINQYKFHKQISEEITFMSMTSEEASAIFNFTLNESMTVKRYNMRLLTHYLTLAKSSSDPSKYDHVMERLHENLGDIYYMDEDYYCAIHEYSNALNYLEKDNSKSDDIIAYLKCCLKIGMSYEYRRTYENAYMMYCRIINKLIHLRWVDERALGLDYTWQWTNDWRRKQPLLMDGGIIRKKGTVKEVIKKKGVNITEVYDEPTHEEVSSDELYDRQINNGIWEDDQGGEKPHYSTGTDDIISALTYNYTPEKSDIVKDLTVFEDIRYVYLAIIAKLFVIEKMELGGLSYSSVAIAEAEFLYLHSATNMNGKFMISADFFYKMAEIMYYKNGYITPVQNVNSLVSALYFYDFNILGYIDDFCFSKKGKELNGFYGAVKVKEVINSFFNNLDYKDCIKRHGERIIDRIKDKANDKKVGEKEDKKGGITFEDRRIILNTYLDYIRPSSWEHIELKQNKVAHCALRRSLFLKIGYKLPCNACRYSYRSLDILMEYLFVDENNEIKEKKNKVSKVIRLLYLTSRKHIRHIRMSELIILAKTVEQMGDIMLSCSSTRTSEFDEMSRAQHPDLNDYDWEQDRHLQDDVTENAIELLEFLSGNTKSETERKAKLDGLENVYLSKLDKSILYYWAASRFYEMASLYKEASYCMERIMKVLQGYLKVVGSSESQRDASYHSIERLFDQNKFLLINNIFKQAARHVGMEFESQIMGEIHEYKWLFHFEHMDAVDMTRLTEFSDLKSIYLIAIDVKIRILEYLKRFNHSIMGRENCQELYRNYISKIYNRISSPFRHDNTFKEEILGYYMKAYVNKLILTECLGEDIMARERKRCNKYVKNKNVLDLHTLFFRKITEYLEHDRTEPRIDNILFNTSSIGSRLKLIEFLIQDSFVCLSSILNILTPHNHITTFSNVFMAEAFDLLWEWSKYYELLYDLYLFRRYENLTNSDTRDAITRMISRNNENNIKLLLQQMKECLDKFRDIIKDKEDGGYQYTRLLMNIRHDVDDATIRHLISNVSAEMSTKYYKMAKDVNNEGAAYKNMITVMYVLDDDLHNDTCQSNLADERFLWHSGYIDGNRDIMIRMYENTSINKMKSYENDSNGLLKNLKQQINDRLEDSIYINSEY